MDRILRTFELLHAKYPSTMGRSYALLAALSSASMTIVMKAISKDINFMSLMPVQAAIANVVCFIIFNASNDSMYNPDDKMTLALLFRGFLGSANFVLFSFGMRVLPLQKFIVLCNTMPIWVVVLSPFLLDEWPDKILVAMLVVSCAGIVIMVDPGLLLPEYLLPHGVIDSDEKEYSNFLLMIPIMGALVGAIISIFLKKFAGRISIGQNSTYFLAFTSFYAGLSASLSSIPPAEKLSSIHDIFFAGITGCFQLAYQTFFGLAIKYEKRASYVSLLINSQIIIAYAMDVILLGNSINLLNLIGGFMIICASAVIALSKDNPPVDLDQRVKDNICSSALAQNILK